MILQWTGAILDRETYEKVNINAIDNHNRTCLHYAAAAGMRNCVEMLIRCEADLFVEDEDRLTACDYASQNHHIKMTLTLESQMVFSPISFLEADTGETNLHQYKQPYARMTLQDLHGLKDMLTVGAADMLQIPLCTAEAVLRVYEWDREKLLDAWIVNPDACCKRAGVSMPTPTQPPSELNIPTSPGPLTSPTDSCLTPVEDGLSGDSDPECEICMCPISESADPVDMSCGHDFCRECWEGFLNVKIQEGDIINICCPAYPCCQLVPVHVIQSVISKEMNQRYLYFDIKAFVDSNPAIHWCPAPCCEGAVQLVQPHLGDYDPQTFSLLPSPAVDCGNGHAFCWECLGEVHEPCRCEMWKNWFKKIREMKPGEFEGVSEAFEEAANALWVLTNCKPCVNCKTLIQKNDGCNHMHCAKCKYDFCWVCMEDWKKHSALTGGYYSCNRFEIIKQLEEQNAKQTVQAEKTAKDFEDLERFMHCYTRFKNYDNSYKLEQELMVTATEKIKQLSTLLIHRQGPLPDIHFIDEAESELLKARHILKCSCPYGFYLKKGNVVKEIYEIMQSDLETAVEDLSQMIHRPCLTTPWHGIMRTARLVQQKRKEFLASVAFGIAPVDLPASSRRVNPEVLLDREDPGFRFREVPADSQLFRRTRRQPIEDPLIENLRSNSNVSETSSRSVNIGMEEAPEAPEAPEAAEAPEAPEAPESSEGSAKTPESSYENDQNTLLSLQESSLHEDLGWRPDTLGDQGDVALHSVNTDSPPGGGLEPELLLSSVIPPGAPFNPSDPQSMGTLDPTANAQLLTNIVAWLNNNNNPQSQELTPHPPTTEIVSSPDTHTETESESQTSGDVTPAPIWQLREGRTEAEDRS